MSCRPRPFAARLAMACVLVSCVAPSRGEPQRVGYASCATAMCHGGVPDRGPAWNSSLNVWESQDRHARAGLLLLDDTAQAIVTCLLTGLASDAPTLADPESTAYQQVLRERCVSCHTAATAGEGTGAIESSLIAGGVSCEACHGPAAEWLAPHKYASWQQQSAAEKLASGMRDLKDWLSRTSVCIRCHVGSRSADGMIRDVDHELIAAGHPALRFDAWLYAANMRPHWSLETEAAQRARSAGRQLPRFESGRLLSLAAAADLERERMEQPDGAATIFSASRPLAMWPDLASYDCFACHRELQIGRPRGPNPQTGFAAWNRWYLAGLSPTLGKQPLLSLGPLSASQVAARQSLLSRVSLTARQDAVAAFRSANAHPDKALGRAVEDGETVRDWHDASFWYLRMLAAIADCEGSPTMPPATISSVQATLDELAQGPLRFGEGWNSPRGFTWAAYDRLYQQIRSRVGNQRLQE